MIHTFLQLYWSDIAIIFGYFVLGFIAELWAIVDEGVTARGVIFNCTYTALAEAIGIAIVLTMNVGIFNLLKGHQVRGLINLSWLTDHGSIWIAIPLAFVILALADFFYYWMHRLQHASKWLWAQHELHHSDEHLNVSSGPRHHWLELPLHAVFIATPLNVFFRMPTVTIGFALIVTKAFGHFIHLNARISFGPLNRIFVTPHVHHIHHSRQIEHADKNFASFLSLWDVLFGSYYHPAQDEWPLSGLHSGRTVKSIPEALLMPFVAWKEMLRPKKASTASASAPLI